MLSVVRNRKVRRSEDHTNQRSDVSQSHIGVQSVVGNALVIIFFLQASAPALAGKWQRAFAMGTNGSPTVNADLIRTLPIQGHAILALYALEVGGGCIQTDETGLQCALTTVLGVAPQCSVAHLQIVRSWFGSGPIPKMSGYADKWYKHAEAPGTLETICYAAPDTSTRQRIWDSIKIKIEGETLFVDAQGTWLVADRTGKFQYRTTYQIGEKSVAVVSHLEVPTKSN